MGNPGLQRRQTAWQKARRPDQSNLNGRDPVKIEQLKKLAMPPLGHGLAVRRKRHRKDPGLMPGEFSYTGGDGGAVGATSPAALSMIRLLRVKRNRPLAKNSGVSTNNTT
jgi:hypothetical protein